MVLRNHATERTSVPSFANPSGFTLAIANFQPPGRIPLVLIARLEYFNPLLGRPT